MTPFQFILVLAMVLVSTNGMMLAMRGRVTPVRVVIVVLCLITIVGAVSVGSAWAHQDFTCHPGQHCFPWGN